MISKDQAEIDDDSDILSSANKSCDRKVVNGEESVHTRIAATDRTAEMFTGFFKKGLFGALKRKRKPSETQDNTVYNETTVHPNKEQYVKGSEPILSADNKNVYDNNTSYSRDDQLRPEFTFDMPADNLNKNDNNITNGLDFIAPADLLHLSRDIKSSEYGQNFNEEEELHTLKNPEIEFNGCKLLPKTPTTKSELDSSLPRKVGDDLNSVNNITHNQDNVCLINGEDKKQASENSVKTATSLLTNETDTKLKSESNVVTGTSLLTNETNTQQANGNNVKTGLSRKARQGSVVSQICLKSWVEQKREAKAKEEVTQLAGSLPIPDSYDINFPPLRSNSFSKSNTLEKIKTAQKEETVLQKPFKKPAVAVIDGTKAIDNSRMQTMIAAPKVDGFRGPPLIQGYLFIRQTQELIFKTECREEVRNRAFQEFDTTGGLIKFEGTPPDWLFISTPRYNCGMAPLPPQGLIAARPPFMLVPSVPAFRHPVMSPPVIIQPVAAPLLPLKLNSNTHPVFQNPPKPPVCNGTVVTPRTASPATSEQDMRANKRDVKSPSISCNDCEISSCSTSDDDSELERWKPSCLKDDYEVKLDEDKIIDIKESSKSLFKTRNEILEVTDSAEEREAEYEQLKRRKKRAKQAARPKVLIDVRKNEKAKELIYALTEELRPDTNRTSLHEAFMDLVSQVINSSTDVVLSEVLKTVKNNRQIETTDASCQTDPLWVMKDSYCQTDTEDFLAFEAYLGPAVAGKSNKKSTQTTATVSKGTPRVIPHAPDSPTKVESELVEGSRLVNVSCQTRFTGKIFTRNIYHVETVVGKDESLHENCKSTQTTMTGDVFTSLT